MNYDKAADLLLIVLEHRPEDFRDELIDALRNAVIYGRLRGKADLQQELRGLLGAAPMGLEQMFTLDPETP